MAIRTRLFSGLAATALAGASVVALAVPANAATPETAKPMSISSCGSGDFCLWGGGDYSGWIYAQSGDISYVGPSVNDASDSLYNAGNYDDVIVYQNANYSGYSMEVYLGEGLPYLGQVSMGGGKSWSDQISSFEWI